MTTQVDPGINVLPPSLYGINGGGAVELGQNVVLTVVFYGTNTDQTYHYQWKKNGSVIAGATSISLTIPAATPADAGTYTVTVSNDGGSSVATTDVTVKPLAAPVITTQPRAIVLQVGQQATFGCVATGSYPRTYQWRRDGANIAGATQATYTIAAVTTADAASYSVVITNSQGSVTSLGASLTVNAATAPVLSSGSPSDTTATAGADASFSIYLSAGSTPFTYQWYKDGNPIAGATASQLTIKGVTVADAGKYSVSVTNAAGSVTSRQATLVVNPATPVTIVSQPTNQTVYEGQSFTVSVYVNGSSPIRYQWNKDGAAITGATSSSYSVNTSAFTDAGRYTVTVTNVAGTVTSAAAVVTINPAVAPTITVGPASKSIAYGGSIDLSVQVAGTPPFQYKWQKDGSDISGATSSSYYISSATTAHSGRYTVTVSNRVGSVTSQAAIVTVAAAVAPTIQTDLVDSTVVEGNTVNLSIRASGTSPLKYQWYGNGAPLSQTYSTLSFTAKMSDAGSYYVVVSNDAGTVTSRTATVTVTPMPPPAVVGLSNQSVVVGQSFSFSASGWYNSGQTYQWYRNGIAITGATDSSYRVDAAGLGDVGDYFVVVTNAGGSTTSRTAHVEITQNSTPPAAAWMSTVRSGDLAYFAFANPARIERFNLATESWLPTIALARTPTAFTVSSTNLFVASGSLIYRYALDGTAEAILCSGFQSDVTGLLVYRDLLLAAATTSYTNPTLTAIRQTDGAILSTRTYIYDWSSTMAAAPSLSRVFSRTSGISPSDITYATVQSNGILSTSATDSPYHGDFPTGTVVYVSPDERLVADNGGTVYTAADLKFAGGLGGRLDDLDFTAASEPVVLRGGVVVAYNAQFQEKGRANTGIAAARIFVRGQDVFAFAFPQPGAAITKAKVSLAQASSPSVGPQLDAATVAFTPDSTIVDRDGNVLLYSKVNRQVFRWSTAQRKFLPPIALQGWPNFVAYSSTNHRLYLGYPDTRILQVKLDAGSLKEETFASAPQAVLALATAGEYVFLVDPTGAWSTYFLFAPDGRMTGQVDWSYQSSEYVWNPVLRRMYHFRDDTSSNDLLYTEITTAGTFGTEKGSANYGQIVTQYPIRISADGGSVLLGTGKFYDASTMQVNNSIANPIEDATWLNNRLFTGRTTAEGVEIQRWGGANYAQDARKVISGRLVRLASLATRQLLAVTVRNGVVSFSIFDENLNVLSTDSGVVPPRLANAATRAWAGAGDQTLIPSFVITGSRAKRVLIRAAGPALVPLGVAGALTDPELTVYNDAKAVVGSNDDWGSGSAEIGPAASKVGAFPFATGSRDAAIVLTLNPGSYTVTVKGGAGGTGVALVEVYDLDDDAQGSRLLNMAARAQVGTGENVLIPSIVIQGATPKTVLIRAVGPGLTSYGVNGVLTDPKLRLFRGSQLMYENDNWSNSVGATAAQITAAATSVGAFPLAAGSKDAVLLVTLPPGGYTAQVSGADGGTGVALVEVYEMAN